MLSRVLIATTIALAAVRGANAEAVCSAKCMDNKLMIAANEVSVTKANGDTANLRADTEALRAGVVTANTTLFEKLAAIKKNLTDDIGGTIKGTEDEINRRVEELTQTLKTEKESLGELRTELSEHIACSIESKIYVGTFPTGTCEYPKVPVCGGLNLADKNREREGGSCVGIYGSKCKTMCKKGYAGGEDLTFQCLDTGADAWEEVDNVDSTKKIKILKDETFFDAIKEDIQAQRPRLHKTTYGDDIYIVDEFGEANWQDAQAACKDMGGKLVEFTNSAQYRHVMQFAIDRTDGSADNYNGADANMFWIGLNDGAGGDECDASSKQTWNWEWDPSENDEGMGSEEDGINHWTYWANPEGKSTEANQGDLWVDAVHPYNANGVDMCCAQASNQPGTGSDGFHAKNCESTIAVKFICQAERNMDLVTHAGSGWVAVDEDGKPIEDESLLVSNMCEEVDECSGNFTSEYYEDTPGYTGGPYQKFDASGNVLVDGLACPTAVDADEAEVFECTNWEGSYDCVCRESGGKMTYAIENKCMLPTIVEDMTETMSAFEYGEDVKMTGCGTASADDSCTSPVTDTSNTYVSFNVARNGEDAMNGKDTFMSDNQGGSNYRAKDGESGGIEVNFKNPVMLTMWTVKCIKLDAAGVKDAVCYSDGLYDFGDIKVQYWDLVQEKFITLSSLKEFNEGNWEATYNPAQQGGPQPKLFRETPVSSIWRFLFESEGVWSEDEDGNRNFLPMNCLGSECTAPSAHRTPEPISVADILIQSAIEYTNPFE